MQAHSKEKENDTEMGNLLEHVTGFVVKRGQKEPRGEIANQGRKVNS